MSFTRPIEPGFSFSAGRLRIFGEDEVIVIQGWPEPTAVRKSEGAPLWTAFLPEFRLVKPYRRRAASRRPPRSPDPPRSPEPPQLAFGFDAAAVRPPPKLPRREAKRRAFDGFRFSLPKEVARALEPFRSHQWLLLLFVRHDPHGLDLARSNPALGYVAAQSLGGRPAAIARAGLGASKQTAILEWLGVRSTKSAVRVFKKLEPRSLTGENWRDLLEVLRCPDETTQQRLGHLPVINAGVLALLADPATARAATPELLAEVAAEVRESYENEVARLLADTLRMQAALPDGRRLPPLRTRARLREVHDEVAEAYLRYVERIRAAKQWDPKSFPFPPLPGVPDRIVPLGSAEALAEESELQRNCVWSYGERVRRGGVYIYRVLAPERATLAIEREPDGAWGIGELRGRMNGPVAPETERAVRRWLERYRLSV